MYPKKELAQTVIAACNQFQIDTVVISPGSRSAPLTVGFTNHKDFKTISIVDERCAAFVPWELHSKREIRLLFCVLPDRLCSITTPLLLKPITAIFHW